MARKKNSTPSYLLHKRSGQARVVWTDLAGLRHEKTLPGKRDSIESRQAYAALIHELASSPTRLTGQVSKPTTLNEVLLAYIDHAEKHYRSLEGIPTDENRHLKTVCRYVRELYGHTPAAEFGPMMLRSVRQKFISLGWSRKTINARIERVRRIFKWAVAEELVSPTVYQALAAVSGLQRGRTDAKERDPILPVDDDVVDATIPHLNRHVRGLVELQRFTGCRPGEACLIRRCDIDMSGTVWLYKPHHHKNAHRSRVIALPASEGSIRGYTAGMVILDEAARIPDAIVAAVRPMLATTGSRLLCISTAFAKSGFFWEQWTGKESWERVRVTAQYCPRISPEFLAEERRALGSRWFAMEYLCEFSEDVAAVFSMDDIRASVSLDVMPMFAPAGKSMAGAFPESTDAGLVPLFRGRS